MKLYLTKTTNDGETAWGLHTEREIINHIDMEDCYEDEEYKVYNLENGVPEELEVRGKWSNVHAPLCIELRDKNTGNMIFAGEGTDH